MQENYKILGVSENASEAEIDAAYERLKSQYSRDRFLEGEAGNIAAKNLTKLEVAYREIKSDRAYEFSGGAGADSYLEIENLIKSGKIAQAQEKLDDVSERDAEWHYLQAVIFYKKNWINESKKQIEIAMNMQPGNKKYSETYTKLRQKAEAGEKRFQSGNANNYENVDNSRQMGGDGMNDCAQFCATWCCVNTMCNICCR